jgi:hypothetical protein
VHVENVPLSRLHLNVLPASLEENENVALAELLGLGGPATIVVSGGVRSIVQVRVAGLPSVFPAASVALTWKVWLPSPSPL